VTLVAQLSPNDQAAPANSGVRQNATPQRTRLACWPKSAWPRSEAGALPSPGMPISIRTRTRSTARAPPQMAGIPTYCHGDTARRTVSGTWNGGSPARSSARGGVATRAAACGTALSAGDGVKVSFTSVTAVAATLPQDSGPSGYCGAAAPVTLLGLPVTRVNLFPAGFLPAHRAVVSR
jgi:hypothetical protein